MRRKCATVAASSSGGALVASTTASTPVRASSRPSPVKRSTPRERLIGTTSWPSRSRAATVRLPMLPVAPATAMRMVMSS